MCNYEQLHWTNCIITVPQTVQGPGVCSAVYGTVHCEEPSKKWNESGFIGHFCAKLGQENLLRMVRWLRWHCPPDTEFEIRALAVWGRARYLSVTEAPHNTNFHTWMGKKHFCFFETAETGNRTPNSGVKGSGANHYPRAPAQEPLKSFYKSNAIIVQKAT